jgi:hypothetical protein
MGASPNFNSGDAPKTTMIYHGFLGTCTTEKPGPQNVIDLAQHLKAE